MAKTEQRNNNGKREKVVLELAESLKFESTMESNVTTTFALSKLINQLMSNVSGDYFGSVIEPNTFGQVNVTLYFTDKGAGDLVPIHTGRQRGESQRSRIQRIGMQNKNKTYNISEDLRDIVEQISMKDRNGRVNVDRNISEVSLAQGGNINSIYLKVGNIDINEILKILFSDKKAISDKTDSRLLYQVRILNPTGALMGIPGSHYMITIDRLNESKVYELANEVGLMAPQASLPIITEL